MVVGGWACVLIAGLWFWWCSGCVSLFGWFAFSFNIPIDCVCVDVLCC